MMALSCVLQVAEGVSKGNAAARKLRRGGRRGLAKRLRGGKEAQGSCGKEA